MVLLNTSVVYLGPVAQAEYRLKLKNLGAIVDTSVFNHNGYGTIQIRFQCLV